MSWIICFLVVIGVITARANPDLTNSDTTLQNRDSEIKCYNDGRWDSDKKQCFCKLGWVGVACAIWRYHECYFDQGLNYRGNFSATKDGLACLPWTTEQNSKFKIGNKGVGFHSYCRNPDNDKKGPWCYVKGNKFHDYCNITVCPDEYRALLMINSTEKDTGSAAVQILFGPLISGICVGVVALLAFVAVFEFRRRKRNAKRRKKLEENAIKKCDIEHVDHEQVKKNKVPTFGGIVTVDVDTGKQKTKTKSAKTFDPSTGNVRSNEAYKNEAFVAQEDGKITSAKGFTLPDNNKKEIPDNIKQRELPPPYTEDEFVKETKKHEEHTEATPTTVHEKQKENARNPDVKRKKRKKRRPVSRAADEDLPEPPPPPAPIPKPRKSLCKTPSSGTNAHIQGDVSKVDQNIEIIEEPNTNIDNKDIIYDIKRRRKRSKTPKKEIETMVDANMKNKDAGVEKKDELVNTKRRTRRQDKQKSEVSDSSPPVEKSNRKHRRRKRDAREEGGNGARARSKRRSRRNTENSENIVNKGHKTDNDVNNGADTNEIETVKQMIKTREKKQDEPSTFI